MFAFVENFLVIYTAESQQLPETMSNIAGDWVEIPEGEEVEEGYRYVDGVFSPREDEQPEAGSTVSYETVKEAVVEAFKDQEIDLSYTSEADRVTKIYTLLTRSEMMAFSKSQNARAAQALGISTSGKTEAQIVDQIIETIGLSEN